MVLLPVFPCRPVTARPSGTYELRYRGTLANLQLFKYYGGLKWNTRLRKLRKKARRA